MPREVTRAGRDPALASAEHPPPAGVRDPARARDGGRRPRRLRRRGRVDDVAGCAAVGALPTPAGWSSSSRPGRPTRRLPPRPRSCAGARREGRTDQRRRGRRDPPADGGAGSAGRRDCLVVVAGMEGALPSVVGGLTGVPAGRGPDVGRLRHSYGGLAALLAMLNSCAPAWWCATSTTATGPACTPPGWPAGGAVASGELRDDRVAAVPCRRERRHVPRRAGRRRCPARDDAGRGRRVGVEPIRLAAESSPRRDRGDAGRRARAAHDVVRTWANIRGRSSRPTSSSRSARGRSTCSRGWPERRRRRTASARSRCASTRWARSTRSPTWSARRRPARARRQPRRRVAGRRRHGMVRSEHGLLPVPGPAVLALL